MERPKKQKEKKRDAFTTFSGSLVREGVGGRPTVFVRCWGAYSLRMRKEIFCEGRLSLCEERSE